MRKVSSPMRSSSLPGPRRRCVWPPAVVSPSPAARVQKTASASVPAARPAASISPGEVGASLEELADRAGPPDVAVVDPPRAGLSGKALRRLARLEASRIVYVSCNPTTLAANVKELAKEWGYSLERVRPVDMFPHTPHVESVALLTRG